MPGRLIGGGGVEVVNVNTPLFRGTSEEGSNAGS